ncbi:MAG: hypothetical protein JRI76_02820 [Deltaproteobacteria bacterium]|nr:hypothetical protein [Deltaproteobacteria bacterium]MBW2040944.1 hypothetical protein [Deltaproteobacteria bacterium]
MSREWIWCLFWMGIVVGFAACANNEEEADKPETVSETGTSMAGASVVRSAVLTVAGAIDARMEAPGDESTRLRGNCPPNMWANFGIQFSHPDYLWVAVTIMTKDAVQPGQTGPVRLDWVDVSFFSKDMKSLFFKGPGTFDISTHHASPENRRMIGVIKASGLKGRDDSEGETLDAEFAFDMNFSCGVK